MKVSSNKSNQQLNLAFKTQRTETDGQKNKDLVTRAKQNLRNFQEAFLLKLLENSNETKSFVQICIILAGHDMVIDSTKAAT